MDPFPALEQLEQKVRQGASCYRFNLRLDAEEIALVETGYRLFFPDTYRRFLMRFNGGMITPEPESYYQDMVDDEPDGPKDSSNFLYSLEELRERYTDLELDGWLFWEEYEGIYPIIPIGRTTKRQQLFLFNQPGFEKESAVFISLDQEGKKGCAQVAPDFASFLQMYLQHEGFPPFPKKDHKGLGQSQIGVHELLALNDSEELPEQVVERMTALIRLMPEDAWNYCERGLAHRELGQRSRALADFTEAIRLHDRKAFYYYCRGGLVLEHGSARKALIDLDTALKLEPGDKLYLYARGEAFFELKRYPQALEDCNSALSQDGFYQLALILRHKVYLAMGEEEKAAADARILDDLDR